MADAIDYALESILKRSHDPLAWLTLSDLYEDAGPDWMRCAKHWRDLGRIGSVILPYMTTLVDAQIKDAKESRETERFFVVDGFAFSVRRTRRLVIVWVKCECTGLVRVWHFAPSGIAAPAGRKWKTVMFKLRQIAEFMAALAQEDVACPTM